MSIIHVNQIKNQIHRLFDGHIDLSDLRNCPPAELENHFLTRGLAAYTIRHLSGCSIEPAAASITDGGDDNGVDALYFDEPNKRLYIVQSKWIHDGVGEPSNGDIKKFVAGVKDLFNLSFDRFNEKVRKKQTTIAQALNDPATRYEIVLSYTGVNSLATPSSRDLEDLSSEMNDTSEVLSVTCLNQAGLHTSLSSGVMGEPINLAIGLKSWGKKEEPQLAVYGQVDGTQVAQWWKEYRNRLFTKNLRNVLGDTDVNDEIRLTLESRPHDFWYFNNGITVLARKVTRSMAGGSDNDFSTFHCEDVSIVNGAQTVGSIGRFSETPGKTVPHVFIPIRIIARGDDQSFAEDVTRTNNRQNKIENRDFVALDPEQNRIKTELAIDGIDYQVVRTETFTRSDTAFDLVEATTAIACASGKIRLVVQLKREIGKLWDDIGKAPYKELFNASVSGLFVWRCVQSQRRIEKALDAHLKIEKNRPYAIGTHGNRMISALIFNKLPTDRFHDPSFALELDKIDPLVAGAMSKLNSEVDKQFPGSIIPTLFKNLKKCELLWTNSK